MYFICEELTAPFTNILIKGGDTPLTFTIISLNKKVQKATSTNHIKNNYSFSIEILSLLLILNTLYNSFY